MKKNTENVLGEKILGLTIEEARKMSPNVRVKIKDGKALMVTMDHRMDRLNVETKDEKIIKVLGYG